MLNEQLARAPLPLGEALAAAVQLARTLEASHEKGVVSADIDIPGCTSPEQLRGEKIDRTSDNWAFGWVLFHLLAGAPPFAGKTAADLTHHVLDRDAEWSRLPAAIPLPLRLLIRRCLQKDPRRRLQFIGDARIEIEQLLSDPIAASAAREAGSRRFWVAWAIVAVLVILVGLVSFPAFQYFRSSPIASPAVRFEEPTPATSAPQISISPDGRRLAYRATGSGSASAGLWIRSLDSPQGHLLPGTENAGSFSWSPDSRSIAFAASPDSQFTKSKLKKIDVSGGAAQALADCGGNLSTLPAWNRDGVILFSGERGSLRRVSARGGEAADVTSLDTTAGEVVHFWPSFLPDQQHFLYQARIQQGSAGRQTIFIGSLDGHTKIRLMDSESMAVYAEPGYVLYVSGQTLMARPFDAAGLAFRGEAIAVADDVMINSSTGRAAFAVSDTGTLVYRRGIGVPQAARSFAWVAATGGATGTMCAGVPGKSTWRLSPDGKTVAVDQQPPTANLWLCDLIREQPLRFTNDSYIDMHPVWSPDGTRIAYESIRTPNQSAMYEKASSGATPERLLYSAEPSTFLTPLDWSRNGKWLVFNLQRAESAAATSASAKRDIWVLPLGNDPKPFAYAAESFDETQASVSPDSRFLAYASNETGTEYDIVVRTFPSPADGKWRVSKNGGCCPRWKGDSSELYYVNQDRHIVAVPVQTTPNFKPGEPATLPMTVESTTQGSFFANFPYDVARDGQRFLVLGPTGLSQTDERSLVVVINWPSALKP